MTLEPNQEGKAMLGRKAGNDMLSVLPNPFHQV